MKIYVVDAFSENIFCGNGAGVAIIEGENFPNEKLMQNIAAELKHSETAFIKRSREKDCFEIKYFTPNSEVDLCGHATVSAFTVLREEKLISCGQFYAYTGAGKLKIMVKENSVWLQMADGKIIKELNRQETAEIYEAFNIKDDSCNLHLNGAIVDTGLADILLCVKDRQTLNKAVMNRNKVMEICRKHNAVGIHMYTLEKNSDIISYCRNFAPLYDIDEECATGTSNGALTYYLEKKKIITKGKDNLFIQGEAMKKPCRILSTINDKGEIYVGGNAVICIKGNIEV